MDHVKQFFDLLDYVTIRTLLYILMVVGAIALVRLLHGKGVHSSKGKFSTRSKKKASQP
jgi:hypothetical protein